MANVAPWSRRSVLTVVALAAALGVIVALGWQAITAARAQRVTVEAVLRDYAEIAAEQYAGGVTLALDYNWIYPVARRVNYREGKFRAPERDAEIRTQEAGEMALSDLVLRFFGGPLEPPAIVGAEGWPAPLHDAVFASVLRDHAPEAVEQGWPAAAIVQEEPPDARLIVFQAGRWPVSGELFIAGFDAPLEGFRAVLDASLKPAEVLPASLAAGDHGEPVALRLVAPGGRVLYARGPEFDPTYSASAPLGARLGGMRVETAIPPSSAAQLVIGGLPRSRLPAIAALLAVAIGLLAGGLLLIRQERELLRLRERFVAGASHELRTPLAQIRMFTETLRLDRVRSEDERHRSLEILDREARRLSYLVENLLHFSRPESREAVAVSEPVDLAALAREVLEGFEPLAAARRTRVELVAHASTAALVDRDVMRQVLLNMLDNATKYGPVGQQVTVSVDTDGAGRAVLDVDDQGDGVPVGDRPHVWTRFWRGNGTAGTTGTGIGLSLVRELVEAHDGEVSVHEAPGGGARFRVSLPGAR